jgi:Sulfotransferase family
VVTAKRVRNAISSWRRRARHSSLRRQGKVFVHLLHIGKTGGTAIKHAIGQSSNVTASHVVLCHEHGTVLRDIPVGDKVMFFLRDPVSRFVSGFYSRQRQGKPRYHSPWNPAEEDAYARFQTPEALGQALSSPDDEERIAAENAMNGIQHISESCWKWLGTPDELEARASDILYVGRQETLDSDFERLKAILNLPPHAKLPTDSIDAHRNPTSVDRKLSKFADDNLRKWYSADYDLIEMCAKSFPNLRLATHISSTHH